MHAASLGPLCLLYRRRGVVAGVPPTFAPAGFAGGIDLAIWQHGGLAWLVIDHRRDPGAASCRAEYWACPGGGEGALGGLVALCDLRDREADTVPAVALAEFVGGAMDA